MPKKTKAQEEKKDNIRTNYSSGDLRRRLSQHQFIFIGISNDLYPNNTDANYNKFLQSDI